MNIEGFTFHDDYKNIESGIIMAELDDIVQILVGDDYIKKGGSPAMRQYAKICDVIGSRLYEMEKNQPQQQNDDLIK